jgi:hypothetical protein
MRRILLLIALSQTLSFGQVRGVIDFYRNASAFDGSGLITSGFEHWKMEEATGNRAGQVHAWPLTPVDLWDGIPDSYRDTGKINFAGAVTVDPANSGQPTFFRNVSIPYAYTDTAGVSFNLWVKLPSGYAPAAGYGVAVDAIILTLRIDSTSMYAFFYDGVADPVGATNNAFTPNTNWMMVTAVYNSATDRFYLYQDGSLTATSPGTYVIGAQPSPSQFFIFPTYSNDPFAVNPFLGGVLIDEVSTWFDHALTAGEISSLYNASSGRTCCPFSP